MIADIWTVHVFVNNAYHHTEHFTTEPDYGLVCPKDCVIDHIHSGVKRGPCGTKKEHLVKVYVVDRPIEDYIEPTEQPEKSRDDSLLENLFRH